MSETYVILLQKAYIILLQTLKNYIKYSISNVFITTFPGPKGMSFKPVTESIALNGFYLFRWNLSISNKAALW